MVRFGYVQLRLDLSHLRIVTTHFCALSSVWLSNIQALRSEGTAQLSVSLVATHGLPVYSVIASWKVVALLNQGQGAGPGLGRRIPDKPPPPFHFSPPSPPGPNLVWRSWPPRRTAQTQRKTDIRRQRLVTYPTRRIIPKLSPDPAPLRPTTLF